MKNNRVKLFKLNKIQKGKCYKLIIIIIYKKIGLKWLEHLKDKPCVDLEAKVQRILMMTVKKFKR